MAVTIPAGVAAGQNFTFQVMVPDAPPVAQPVMAQPVMAQPVMAQPVMAQPVMAQPVMAQPAVHIQPAQAPPTVIIQQQPMMGGMPASIGGAPPGAPEGGRWVTQSYCGDTTCIAAIVVAFLFWPAVCCVPACKCDERTVYMAPNGVLYFPNGVIAPADSC